MPTSGKKHFRNSAQQHAKPQENTLVIRTGCGTGMRNDALAMLRRDVASGDIGSTEQAMNMLPMAQRNAYNRLAGEAESRLAEARIDMSPAERAAQYPWAEDCFKQATGVSKGDLIHRGGLGLTGQSGLLNPEITKATNRGLYRTMLDDEEDKPSFPYGLIGK